MISTDPDKYIKISKDHLREVNPQISEDKIIDLRDNKIRRLIDAGFVPVVEDSNLDPKHETRFKELAEELDLTLVCIDLTDVPLREAIERDWEREDRLGPIVIAGMYKKYIKGKEAEEKEQQNGKTRSDSLWPPESKMPGMRRQDQSTI